MTDIKPVLPLLANEIEEITFGLEGKVEILRALGRAAEADKLATAAHLALEVSRMLRKGAAP
jgi:hypothetical protein